MARKKETTSSGGISDIYPPFINPYAGRPLSYKPAELTEKFAEYIEWAKAHPLEHVYDSRGRNDHGTFSNTNKDIKPRLISISGFLVYIGKTESWWKMLDTGKRGEEFLKVKENIKTYCENFQKEMAAAGIFKENIISRLLGLKDKQEVENKGESYTIIVNNKEEKEKIEAMKDLQI